VVLEALSDEVLRERFGLTPIEIAVARLMAEGRSTAGIAVALCISPHTARYHMERVMAKLRAA
jgi:DNA-binding CsgD family transcriptional regulator